jgi:hypothetical protein
MMENRESITRGVTISSTSNRSSTIPIPSSSGRWFDECSSTISIPYTSTIWILVIFIPSSHIQWFDGWSCSFNIFIPSTFGISIPYTTTYSL